MRSELQQIDALKARFAALKQAGFFSDQNRLVARRRITDIQQKTGVLQAKYDIGSGQVVKAPGAEEAGYAILKSKVSVSVEALDDIDVYNFIYWMENTFPGHMMVASVKMTRPTELNEAVLRAIGSGQATTLIKADLVFSWRTMVAADSVSTAPSEDQGTGG
jgi:hypothetical protein